MIFLIVFTIGVPLGIMLGIVLRNNGVTPYGLGNDFGRHYLKNEGIDLEKDSPGRFDD